MNNKLNARPLAASAPAALLLIACFWFSLSDMDYQGGNPLFSLRTGGWFYLGFPFMAVLAYLLASTSAATYRRLGAIPVGMILLLLIACLYYSVMQSLPQGRLSRIIGNQLAREVTAHRLIVNDSFNGGTTIFGELTGKDNLLEEIAEYRPLLKIDIVPAYVFHVFHETQENYDTMNAYEDLHAIFYRSAQSGRIMFRYRSRVASQLSPDNPM